MSPQNSSPTWLFLEHTLLSISGIFVGVLIFFYSLNPKEPYIPFKVIEGKIHCDNRGKYMGWGLKLFP